MARDIVKISDRKARIPEAGRLRMGEKHGRAMRSLKAWRLTSPKREYLEDAAVLYGGTPRPWNDAKANPPNQFELYTETATLDVYLVPDAMSIYYETWTGGGVGRRCDGETCEQPRSNGDDVDIVSVPCLCRAEGAMTCDPHTRLSVVLPGIRFGGVWRLETKSWNALDELVAMESFISDLQDHGVTKAKLTIDARKQVIAGKTRHFVVPVLWVDSTPEDIALGRSSIQALAAGKEQAALTTGGREPSRDSIQVQAGPPGPDREEPSDWFSKDDEILDAEIVDEGAVTALPETDDGRGESAPTQLKPKADRMRSKMVMLCVELADKNADDLRHAVSWFVSKGATESSKDLDEALLSQALDRLEKATNTDVAALLKRYSERPL